ncbi:sortase domain-bontaining protein [Peribacillus sp. SCS-26]|uniref:class F sortase n=1 Tax=Paraperibacillus marinus TaxID=3115295 RepID=UPI00390674F4
MKALKPCLAAAGIALLLTGCQDQNASFMKTGGAGANNIKPVEVKKEEKPQDEVSEDPVFKEFNLLKKETKDYINKRMELERTAMASGEGLEPSRIIIPSIKVDAKIERVGLLGNNQPDVPKDDRNAAWFEPGTKPGRIGSAVIDGHVDNKSGPAVFFRLKELKPGAEIILLDKKSKKMVFSVERKKSYPYNEAPIKEIFGTRDKARLNLITCTGLYDRSTNNHEKRLVVYSKLKTRPQPEKILPLPEAPADTSINGSLLTWHAVRKDTIAGYRIYEKLPDGELKKIKSISTMQRKSYTLPESSKADYFVASVDIYGQESKHTPFTRP